MKFSARSDVGDSTFRKKPKSGLPACHEPDVISLRVHGLEQRSCCLLELRLIFHTEIRRLQHVVVCLRLNTIVKARHGTVCNVSGLDVLDDGTVGPARDQWDSKRAAQVRMQVPRADLVVVGDDAHKVL